MEDRRQKFLPEAGKYPPDYTVSNPSSGIKKSKRLQLLKPNISV
jgi:hypothetical protein